VAWISYLRWVVLIDWCFVWWCPAVGAACSDAACCGAGCRSFSDLPILVASHPPAPAVGRVALPGTGRWMSDRNRSPLATRRRHLPDHHHVQWPGGGPRQPGGHVV